MSLSILNNIPSLEAQNQLAMTNANLQNTLFQLSSGSKINSGADDPAGLSIANGLQANISALSQSAQNVTDGVGLLQTADGALSQVTSLLNRAVTLATEAANTGLTTDQQTALQTEFNSITNEINQIGNNTTYNNTAILNGSNPLMSVFLSDGSAVDTGNAAGANSANITMTMPSLSAAGIGLGSYATGTLDLSALPTSGNTVTIGNDTYTFVNSGSASTAGQVAIGTASANATAVENTLQNLMNAVNGTGTAGVTTFAAVAANNEASIVSITGGSALVQALAAGAPASPIALTANLTNAAGDTSTQLGGALAAIQATGTLSLVTNPNTLTAATQTLQLGAGGPQTGQASGTITLTNNPVTQTTATSSLVAEDPIQSGDTVAIGGTTYTFQDASFDFTTGGGNDVSIGANANASALTNLADAITNGSGGVNAGETYDSNMVSNANIATATFSGTTGQFTVTAATAGAAGNVTITPTMANAGAYAVNTAGVNGDTVSVGNQTYTFVAAGSTVAGSNDVGVVAGDYNATLQNLMGAVNAAVTTQSSGAGFTLAGLNTQAEITGVNGGVASVKSLADDATTVNFQGTGSMAAALTTTGTHVLGGGANGDTVSVGGVTYTFVGAGQAKAGNEVEVGANNNATLQNLEAALGAGIGQGAGYSVANVQGATGGTITNITNAGNGSVATITDKTTGTGGNNDLNVGTSVASSTIGAQVLGTNADTVTVGATTYTFVASGNASAADTVAVGNNAQATLNNLQAALAGGTGSTSTFGAGGGTLAANVTAQITATTADSATVTATAVGATGNGGTLSATFLASGTGNVVGGNALGLATGANATNATATVQFNGQPTAGNTVTIGAQTYTFVAAGTAQGSLANNDVVIGSGGNAQANLTATLTNLQNALTTTGTFAGYKSGTANVDATISNVNVNGGGTQGTITVTSTATGLAANGTTVSAQLGAGAGGVVNVVNAALTGGNGNMSLMTTGAASQALASIETAISNVALSRGQIGSSINQMNAALDVMNNTSQNLTSSMSGIQDANIGQVVANMSKYQVLEQTGISALAQSNSNEQAVLKLLQ